MASAAGFGLRQWQIRITNPIDAKKPVAISFFSAAASTP